MRYDGEPLPSAQSEAQRGPGFSSLKPHQDESVISMTVCLNDRADYEEGGLWIASTGDVLSKYLRSRISPGSQFAISICALSIRNSRC